MPLLDWFDRVHPLVKLAFVLCGTLMTGFSSRLPEQWQDFGLWTGLAVGVIALIGLALHAIRDFRGGEKVAAADVIMLGLGGLVVFAAIALGGVIWHFKSPAIAKSENRPAVMQQAKVPDLPAVPYYSKDQKEILAGLMFKISQLLNTEVDLAAREGLAYGGRIDSNTAKKTITEKLQLLKQNHERVEAIYPAWKRIIAERPDQTDELRKVVGDILPPLNKYDVAKNQYMRFIDALEKTFDTIPTGPREAIISAGAPSADQLHATAQELRAWVVDCNKRIESMRVILSK